jgi:DegV family protein with EDD domain
LRRELKINKERGFRMRKIVITTESGNDVPYHLVKKYDITVVPMYISMDNKTFADGSILVQQIYDYYARTSKVPTTSASNVYDFVEAFEKIREKYPDSVIFHLAYSAATTCAYQNAKIAAEDFDDIYLVDTKLVSGGATAYIVKAMELINKRKDEMEDTKEAYEALAKELSELSNKVHFSFLPGNLEFLRAGGRLSNVAYLGATLLRVKPLIELIDGKLVATKKYIGSIERAIPRFIKDFVEEHNISKKSLYVVATGGLSDKAERLIHSIAENVGFKHHEINPCGLVITCHSGPSAIGIGGWEECLD